MYDQFETRDLLYDLYEISLELTRISAEDVFVVYEGTESIKSKADGRVLSPILSLYCDESFRARIQLMHINYRSSFNGNGLRNAMKVICETINLLRMKTPLSDTEERR
jgi:hypothetical protein